MDNLTEKDLNILRKYGFDKDTFEELRTKIQKGELTEEHNIEKRKIEPPPKESLIKFPEKNSTEWTEFEEKGKQAIRNGEFALAILNGGMATRFGGKVKGIINVVKDVSFLELKIRHAKKIADECGGKIPILLMNSWATENATLKHLEEKNYFDIPKEEYFMFSQYLWPRITLDGNIYRQDDGTPSFYGPGHGDFPIALKKKGGLDWLKKKGIKYMLVANVDNLGAKVDPVVLGLHIKMGKEATVEVAEKWPGDQGGCPALINGKIQILEGFRFPKDYDQDQIDVFNCNTFTFTINAFEKEFHLPFYVVKKKIGKDVFIQFERLIGEVTGFLDCIYLVVPRTGKSNRFYPVKTPKDLEEAKDIINLLYPEYAEEGEFQR